jgi:hypothetical protein
MDTSIEYDDFQEEISRKPIIAKQLRTSSNHLLRYACTKWRFIDGFDFKNSLAPRRATQSNNEFSSRTV